MRAALTVGHRVYTPGATDAHGNAADAWAPAVDLKVFGVAPRSSDEPNAGRDEVVTGLSVLAPAGTVVGPLDLLVLGDDLPAWSGEWKVVGDLADWTRGPFGFKPGVVIHLTRAEG